MYKLRLALKGVSIRLILKMTIKFTGCSLEISIDDYYMGEWELDGFQKFNIERPAYEDRKFTFYRDKLAPAGSGIQEGRPENGLISCVFTPEARISALVKSHVLPEPIKIEMPPHATVREMKQEAQRRLGLKEDLEQILSKDRQVLNNDQVLRYCCVSCVMFYHCSISIH